jgi:hypothetical protein
MSVQTSAAQERNAVGKKKSAIVVFTAICLLAKMTNEN